MHSPSGKIVLPVLLILAVVAVWLMFFDDGVERGASPGPVIVAPEAGAASALAEASQGEAVAVVDAEAGALAAREDVGGKQVRTGVRGTLIDAKTRRPLAGVEVMAMRQPPGFERLMTRFRSAFFEGKGLQAGSVPPPEILARAETAPDGSFELFGLPTGSVFIDGRADFTFVRTPKRLRLARGQVIEGVQLVGQASGRIQGKVYGPDGLPASNVAITVRPGLNSFLGQVTQKQYRWLETKTDANGDYDMPGVPEGPGYSLSAAGSLMALAEAHGIDVREGEVTRVDISGRTGATVEGRVFDLDGSVCEGANLALVYLDVSRALFSADGRSEPIVTNAEGRFALRHVAAGRIAFIAAKDDRAPSEIIELAVVDGGVYDQLELTLGEGREFGGIVVDQDDVPVAGATVQVRPMERPDSPDVMKMMLEIREIEMESGADGRFDTESLTARKVFVQTSKAGYVTDVRMRHDAEEEDDLRIQLVRGVTIRGRVVDAEGVPIERFRVDTRSREPKKEGEEEETAGERRRRRWGGRGGRSMRIAEGQKLENRMFDGRWRDFSDADGRFEIRGVPPGRIRIRVRADGFRNPEDQNIELVAGATSDDLQFALQPGAIARGRVVEASSGTPVADAQVTAYRSRDAENGGRGRGFFRMNFDRKDVDFLGMSTGNSATTDGEGRFEILGLAEGDYRFTARHPERAKSSVKDVSIALGDGSSGVVGEDILIEIETGGGIVGTVTGRGGEPLPDALIVAFSMAAGSFKSASTDRAGSYKIEGLPGGQYAVFKSKIGERAMNIGYDLLGNMRLKTVSVRKNEVTRFDIQDETENSVRVWGVVRDGGEPVDSGMVTAMSTDSDGFLGLGIRAKSTGTDGRYELVGLTPGDYFFQVSRFNKRPQQANLSIEIPEGVREFRVDLDLPQSSLSGRVVDSLGQPVKGVVVRAGVEEGGIDDAPGLLGLILKNGVAQDRTDDDGRFKLDKMAEGVYRISASGQGGRRALRKYGEVAQSGVVIDGLGAAPDLDLVLPLAGVVRGKVIDGSGLPVAGAEVVLSRQDQKSSASTEDQLVDLFGLQARPEKTDSEGVFEITGVTPGVYRVRADADGLAPGVADDVTVAEESSVDVQLQVVRGATVRVRARNVDGEQIPFAQVSVFDSQGKPLASKVSVMSVFKRMMGSKKKKEDSGWYTVGNIPPDTYTVVITEPGQPEVKVSREVRDGETIDWDIDVGRELEASGRARK